MKRRDAKRNTFLILFTGWFSSGNRGYELKCRVAHHVSLTRKIIGRITWENIGYSVR